MLKLFYAPNSCALASHVALEEAGADYGAVRVDLAGGEQRSPEYLKINPKGRVPALVTDRGVLTENPVILGYVAQTHPEARLAPNDDPFAFGRMQAFNVFIASTLHVAFAHHSRAERWSDDPAGIAAMKAKAPKNYADLFQLMQDEMVQGPWVMGEAYSVADPYLYIMTRWLSRVDIDVARFPVIADHFRRMGERPAVQRVLEQEGLS